MMNDVVRKREGKGDLTNGRKKIEREGDKSGAA